MNTIFAKLRLKGKTNKYRKVLSTEEEIYKDTSTLIDNFQCYNAETLLEDGEWFKIEHASQQSYAIDIIQSKYDSVDYDSLTKEEFPQIDYIFVKNENNIYFQNVSKAKLVSKKGILTFGNAFRYENDSKEIVINDLPDAIYCNQKDELYFRKLESITGIFKNITELYNEATDSETEQFLKNDFILLTNGYGVSSVKKANRKRIALALKTLSRLSPESKLDIFNYICEYCPDLKKEDNRFTVGTEDDLKMILFGIEQRYYTTPVGGEKRIANSVIKMN